VKVVVLLAGSQEISFLGSISKSRGLVGYLGDSGGGGMGIADRGRASTHSTYDCVAFLRVSASQPTVSQTPPPPAVPKSAFNQTGGTNGLAWGAVLSKARALERGRRYNTFNSENWMVDTKSSPFGNCGT